MPPPSGLPHRSRSSGKKRREHGTLEYPPARFTASGSNLNKSMNIHTVSRVKKHRTIFVCGGLGFSGSNFIRHVLASDKNVKIVNLDALTYAGNPDNVKDVPKSRYTFVRGDICDVSRVKKLMAKADVVVNFAAETHVDRSIHGEFANFFHSNIRGVYALLEALKVSPRVERMIHVSTDEVWGDLPFASKKRFTENSPFRPNSPYAASKAAGDLLIRSYVHTYRLPIIVAHATNFFGPRQFPEKLIPFFALRALHGEQLPLYGTGKNIREWLHVDDYARALVLLLKQGKIGETYLVSTGEGVSNKTIAENILDILGKPRSLLAYVHDRPGHDRKYALDPSKIKALGWRPVRSLREDLERTIRWYAENEAWIKKSLRRTHGVNRHIVLK